MREGEHRWVDLRKQQGSVPRDAPGDGSVPTPMLSCLASPYFLDLEAVLVAFLAGFAFALAIGPSPSFTCAPGSLAKV